MKKYKVSNTIHKKGEVFAVAKVNINYDDSETAGSNVWYLLETTKKDENGIECGSFCVDEEDLKLLEL